MKLDVLDEMDTIKICTGYRYRNDILSEFPASLKVLAECTPIYEEIPGWCEDTTKARSWDDFPLKAQGYLKRIAELAEAPVEMISVGWRRDETILRNQIW